MSHFGIAGLQLELSAGDNLELIERELRFTKTVFPWVKMIVLSELCSYGADVGRAEALPSAAYAFYAEQARAHAIYLVAGSLFERRGERTYNLTLIFDPEGNEVARYAKMYPFEPYEQGVTPGEDFCVFDLPGAGRFGVSICYDMWFPETTRTLAWMGAEVILHPTMTGTIDRDAELAIARASAVTNQVYFFDINGAGGLGNGRSVVVDPEGRVLHQAGSGREIIPIEVDFEQLRRSRERGLMNLGQPLKSFRDHWRPFPPYQPGAQSKALDSLGKLEKPEDR
jgi:predicted amidohydrolase